MIVVYFRAFDRQCNEAFINKTWVQIHTALKEICDTYVVTCILSADNFTNQPLSVLENLKP